MKCLACGSDDIYWVTTIMFNDEEGYEVYVCPNCRSRSEFGIKVNKVTYNGIDNVYPVEKE